MTPIQKALLLSAAVILLALAGALDFIPDEAAKFAFLLPLVLLPWAIGTDEGKRRKCQ